MCEFCLLVLNLTARSMTVWQYKRVCYVGLYLTTMDHDGDPEIDPDTLTRFMKERTNLSVDEASATGVVVVTPAGTRYRCDVVPRAPLLTRPGSWCLIPRYTDPQEYVVGWYACMRQVLPNTHLFGLQEYEGGVVRCDGHIIIDLDKYAVRHLDEVFVLGCEICPCHYHAGFQRWILKAHQHLPQALSLESYDRELWARLFAKSDAFRYGMLETNRLPEDIIIMIARCYEAIARRVMYASRKYAINVLLSAEIV